MEARPQMAPPPREYETIFILHPDLDEGGIEKVCARVGTVVEKNGGNLLKVDVWGKKKLAYRVKRHGKGHYVYLRYIGQSQLIAEVERSLRLMDIVLKYQTVLLEDEVDAAKRLAEVTPEQVRIKRELADADIVLPERPAGAEAAEEDEDEEEPGYFGEEGPGGRSPMAGADEGEGEAGPRGVDDEDEGPGHAPSEGGDNDRE